MGSVLLPYQVLIEFLSYCSHGVHLSIDEAGHSVHIFLNFVQALVDRGDSVKFVLGPAEDAIGTE